MITFYHHPLSLYCVKVRLVLEEAGCTYEARFVDLAKGEQRHPDFLRKNPFGKVPVIDINGFAMAESGAIMRYLAERYQRFDLWPRSLEDRATVDQWVEVFNTSVCEPLSDLIWYRAWAPKFGYAPDHAADAKAVDALKKLLPVCDAHLMGRNYFAGPQPTLADLTLLPFAGNAWRAGMDFAEYPRIRQWLARMTERPAWKRVNVTQ